MQIAHSEHYEDGDLFDFMALTGHDFAAIPVCQSEIEIARSKICDSVHAEIVEIERKNEALKNSEDTNKFVYGFSVSEAAFKYCDTR